MKDKFLEALMCLLPVPIMARYFSLISWKTFLEVLLIIVVSVCTTLYTSQNKSGEEKG